MRPSIRSFCLALVINPITGRANATTPPLAPDVPKTFEVATAAADYVKRDVFAKPADYRKATQRIYTSGESASHIELPVVANP